MQWAAGTHGFEGKVLADRRTVEYTGRGQTSRDAVRVRTTRPVSSARLYRRSAVSAVGITAAAMPVTVAAVSTTSQPRSAHNRSHRKTPATPCGSRPDTDTDDGMRSPLSSLRVFYYETLVVSTCDDDHDSISGGDDSGSADADAMAIDAQVELELLMARVNGSDTSTSTSISHNSSNNSRPTAAPHPYANNRAGSSRLPWRMRARRIVHANLHASEPLLRTAAAVVALRTDSDGGTSASADTMLRDTSVRPSHTERMELDDDNGDDGDDGANETATSRTRARSAVAAHGFDIRQFLAGSNGAAVLPPAAVSVANGAAHQPPTRSLIAPSRSTSAAAIATPSTAAAATTTITNSSSSSSSPSNMHFAFTLSSRTLQQMRSRHDRRRLRRQQEKKRFSHRVAVGFVLALPSPSSQPTAIADTERASTTTRQVASWSQSSSSSSISISSSSTATSSNATLDANHAVRPPMRATPFGHEDLGRDACSLAYNGRTGRVTSNGQVFLQCERFGAGDIVGCGLLLDSKTFFFTLNGRLLGLLAATDVHHLDAFVDAGTTTTATRDAAGSSSDTDDDTAGVFDDGDDSDTSDTTSESTIQFEDMVFPAVSLHSAGECVSASFDAFQFDVAGFARQIEKERQHALLLHDAIDERDDLATDRVLHALVQDYLLHYGYADAYTSFVNSVSADASGLSVSMRSVSNGVSCDNDDDGNGTDDEEHKCATDTNSGHRMDSDMAESESDQIRMLHLRHRVRQSIYAFDTARALECVRTACSSSSSNNAHDVTATRRSRNALFYTRVLCVIDALVAGGDWHVDNAIRCAQTLFTSDDTASSSSDDVSRDDDDVAADVLPQLLTLLLYARRADVPPDCSARKFLTRAFREHVADALNALLLRLVVAVPHARKVHTSKARVDPPQRSVSGEAAPALQTFLEDLQMLQSQCLRNGCRVFPGNHTVSSVGRRAAGRNTRHHDHEHHRRRRHQRQHGGSVSSSSETGGTHGGREQDVDDDRDDDDAHMRGSSESESDASSASSRSENDDDDEDDDDEEEEE